jgi:hypothetical protein
MNRPFSVISSSSPVSKARSPRGVNDHCEPRVGSARSVVIELMIGPAAELKYEPT